MAKSEERAPESGDTFIDLIQRLLNEGTDVMMGRGKVAQDFPEELLNEAARLGLDIDTKNARKIFTKLGDTRCAIADHLRRALSRGGLAIFIGDPYNFSRAAALWSEMRDLEEQARPLIEAMEAAGVDFTD